jgi:hypothetical protein
MTEAVIPLSSRSAGEPETEGDKRLLPLSPSSPRAAGLTAGLGVVRPAASSPPARPAALVNALEECLRAVLGGLVLLIEELC